MKNVSLEALTHFEIADSRLFKMALKVDFEHWFGEVYSPNCYFERLCQTIVGQQLAGVAARAIYGRLTELVGDDFTPETILETDHEALRLVGLSNAKVLSIHDLALKVQEGLLPFESFAELSDDEVVELLVQVRGIGQWTAEMFMMFTLQREDVYSLGDLGLKKGMKKLYELSDYPTPDMAIEISKKWAPYRTYGCCVLWHVADLVKIGV